MLSTLSLLFLFIGIFHNQIYAAEEDFDENIVGHPKIVPLSVLKQTQSTTDRARRSESAERYFDWIEKNQRPMEYFRGKRFWLFAKKDESPMNVEYVPTVHTKQNSLEQGLWRSGIVGRRRR